MHCAREGAGKIHIGVGVTYSFARDPLGIVCAPYLFFEPYCQLSYLKQFFCIDFRNKKL